MVFTHSYLVPTHQLHISVIPGRQNAGTVEFDGKCEWTLASMANYFICLRNVLQEYAKQTRMVMTLHRDGQALSEFDIRTVIKDQDRLVITKKVWGDGPMPHLDAAKLRVIRDFAQEHGGPDRELFTAKDLEWLERMCGWYKLDPSPDEDGNFNRLQGELDAKAKKHVEDYKAWELKYKASHIELNQELLDQIATTE